MPAYSTAHPEPEPAAPGPVEISTEVRRQEAVLKTGALQNAILNSANFSSIATDEKGVIQLFNVGAERMLGYAAADVVNRITLSVPVEEVVADIEREMPAVFAGLEGFVGQTLVKTGPAILNRPL